MNCDFKYIKLSIACLLIIAISACNLPQTEGTTDLARVVAQTQTSIAIEQLLTNTARPLSPTGTDQAPETSVAFPTTPSPSQTASPTIQLDCTNKAKYVAETIPDESIFKPGELFTKSWTLRNVGTCTWNSGYSLIFEKGEKMGGVSPMPLTQTVPPDGSIDLTIDLIAPEEAGQFQGFWLLSPPIGDSFGLGEEADVAFWVKIIVESDTPSGGLELGNPTWVDTFDDGNTNHFYLGSDSTVNFEIENGALIMTAFIAAGDQWRVAERGYIDDFYLESIFRSGDTCSGEDSYGMIIRAPDQPDNIIDSGYVLVFSCDGKYRIYRMDNGAYTGIINWTAHPSIKKGSDQTNKMGVKALGEIMQFYANGTLIAEITDLNYEIGYFGLVIRSKNTPDFTVFVNEISYWDLS